MNPRAGGDDERPFDVDRAGLGAFVLAGAALGFFAYDLRRDHPFGVAPSGFEGPY